MYPFNDPALPLNERVRDLISRLTVEEKAGLFPTHNHAIERLGIPEWMFGGEAAHGFVNRFGCNTTFPQTIGLAASWDRSLLHKVGEIAATEARWFFKARDRKGGLAFWSPTIDLERDPRWGRTEEGYGEDPFLTGELSVEYVRGAQGEDPFYLRVTCGPKHFIANNNEKDRGSCSCFITPRLLHEYYLQPFRAAIQRGKAASLMTSYNEVNGIPMVHHPILKSIVKDSWRLQGNIVTDGGDFGATVNEHNYFETHGESFAEAMKNGNDSMTDSPVLVVEAVKEALEKKFIEEADLDEHLERILSIRFRFGLFDPPGKCPYDLVEETDELRNDFKKAAREAVRKSAVLLKNENSILPLKKSEIKGTIAVMGPLAKEVHADWYAGRPDKYYSPLEGLKELYGEKAVFTDTRDVVSFTTEDGRPLILMDITLEKKEGEEGKEDIDDKGDKKEKIVKTLATGNLNENPANFYVDDWGWGVKTLTDTESGLMLISCYDRKKPGDVDDSKFTITAAGKNNTEWFGFTLFNIVPQENETVLIKTHDNRRIVAKETGVPVIQYDNPLPVKGELFKMKLEHDGLKSAEKAAKNAEQVIIFAGNDPMINGREAVDRPSLNFPPRQEELIDRTLNANSRTILFIISGYPYTCGKIAEKVPAIVWMAHGIQETGHGIADILNGYSPAGRLPLTWYQDENQLPDMMEYDIIKGGTTYQYFTGKVLWPFGYGLSYSSFSYSEIKIDKTTATAKAGDLIIVSFKLKNTGKIDAEETPQMYVTVSGSVYKRPVKSLKGFTRLMFKSGEEKVIIFNLSVNDLAVWDSYKEMFCIEAGYCNIQIGSSSADIRLTTGFNINAESLYPRTLKQIYAQNFDDYSNIVLHDKRGSGISAVFANFNFNSDKKETGWIKFCALDFKDGFSKLSAVVQGGRSSKMEIRLDAVDGRLAGTVDIPNTGDISFYPLSKKSYRNLSGWGYVETNFEKICGVHDVYLILHGNTGLWSFEFLR